MKKITLLMTAIAFSASSYAQQITLTQSDWPYAGLSLQSYTARSGTLNLNDSVSVGSAGASGSYDFSKVNFFVIDTNDFNYVSPSSMGWAANHPTADMALMDELEIDSASGDTVFMFYTFFSSNTNNVQLVGYTILLDTAAMFSGNPSGVLDVFHATNDLSDTIVTADYTLGYTDKDSSYFLIDIGTFTHEESISQDIEVDGWGDMVTPFGTFSVLRVKVTERASSVDKMNSVVVDSWSDTSYYYEYWAKGAGYPVVVAEMTQNWTGINGVEFLNVLPVGIPQLSLVKGLELYPNPVVDNLTLVIKDQSLKVEKLVIYNAVGQKMHQQALGAAGSYRINVSGLNKGLYIVVLQDSGSRMLYARNIVISK